MKTRALAAIPLIAAGILASTQPADAAVTYTVTQVPVRHQFGAAAVDPGTGDLWAGVNTMDDPSANDDDQDYVNVYSSAHKLLKQLSIGGEMLQVGGIKDIEFSPKNHVAWVLQGPLYEFDTRTFKLLRTIVPGGDVQNLQIDLTSGTVYYATGSYYNPGTQLSPIQLNRIDGATYAQTSVNLPQRNLQDGYIDDASFEVGAPVAFDQANFGIYVAGPSIVWAYTNKLKLSHTTLLPGYNGDGEVPGITADSATQKVFLTGHRDNDYTGALITIDGKTGNLASTSALAATNPPAPVADPSISTLYVGTTVYSTSTSSGKPTGALPGGATSVNTTTHAITSSTASDGVSGYVDLITRKG